MSAICVVAVSKAFNAHFKTAPGAMLKQTTCFNRVQRKLSKCWLVKVVGEMAKHNSYLQTL